MTASTPIDTTGLLTILGVIAAVWALISPTNRLRLRFCMTWADWLVGGATFLLIHYLVFAPALDSLGLYYSLGPWRWGLESSSAVYLLLLSAALYFFWRTRSPTLVRGRVHVFRELVENLHLTKRYDELVLLVEPQLPTLICLAREESGTAGQEAREILLNLVTSPELTVHLAQAHPHFCLKLVEADEAIRADFIARYIDALLEASGSRLYVELKNNQNLRRGSRLHLPESNRLLSFFFSDAAAAVKNGLDAAIGEAVLRRLNEDRQLTQKLNEPLGSYYEVGRFRCPINSGITLFEIMVHEGIHQALQDHMWLHYFAHFAEAILKQMSWPPDEEAHEEWPTPLHYLLYRLISIATDWTEQCGCIDDSEIPQATRIAAGFDRNFISKEATKALGSMLEDIIPSDKLSASFKTYLLEVAIRGHLKLEGDRRTTDVASSFREAVITGTALPTSLAYRRELRKVFGDVDHVMRRNAGVFEESLDASLL